MAESKKHRETAKRIARKLRATYNSGEGVDIISKRATVEVETERTIQDAKMQLQGYRGPVYIAGVDQKTTAKALVVTKGSTIGVMDQNGNILKRSSRMKW